MLFDTASASWLEIGDISISGCFVVPPRQLPTSRLLASNDFRVARDLGVVERMLPRQVRAAIFTVGLPRRRCAEDTGFGC